MTEPIRFHLDENVDSAIAQGLRRRGVDVTTTAEAKLVSASDQVQMAHAVRQGRVVVTHDDDFLALAKRGVSHAGIAYCHCASRTIGEIVDSLLIIQNCLSPEEMRNHIEYL